MLPEKCALRSSPRDTVLESIIDLWLLAPRPWFPQPHNQWLSMARKASMRASPFLTNRGAFEETTLLKKPIILPETFSELCYNLRICLCNRLVPLSFHRSQTCTMVWRLSLPTTSPFPFIFTGISSCWSHPILAAVQKIQTDTPIHQLWFKIFGYFSVRVINQLVVVTWSITSWRFLRPSLDSKKSVLWLITNVCNGHRGGWEGTYALYLSNTSIGASLG